MLYDAHAHLDLMEEDELLEALKKAKDAGIEKIISCSTSFFSNQKNLLLAQKNPKIKAAIGLYPLDAMALTQNEIEKAFDYFKEKIEKKEVIAIGEVGLDFKYGKSGEEQEKQKKVFERFICLSNEKEKPLIIHSRYAQRQVIEMLKKHKAQKALLHSFVDSPKLMNQAKELGYFISAGTNLLYNEEVQKNIANFPIEKLLFETDSPIRCNTEKTYPEKAALIAKKISEIKKIPLKEIEKQQEKNFKELFGQA